MAVVNSLLLAAHLVGVVLVGGAALVLWRAADLLAGGERSGQGLPNLGRFIYGLGNAGLGLAWVSGLILLFSKFNGFSGLVALGPWFWLKIVFVIALSGMLGAAGANFKRAVSTQPTAAAKAAGLGGIAVVCTVAVLVTAAFAFG